MKCTVVECRSMELEPMCELTYKESTILANLRQKVPGLVATELGISRATLDVYLSRIRKKRVKCQKFLSQTDQYKKEMYPKRKGE